jgi:hypothetical protein
VAVQNRLRDGTHLGTLCLEKPTMLDPCKNRRTRPLTLETLEDRLAPAVTVTTPFDLAVATGGQLSLRQAINAVNAGQVSDNTVVVPAGTYLNVFGVLQVTHSLHLQGAGAAATIVDGAGADRVFLVQPGLDVTLLAVTIRGGSAAGSGGGIDVLPPLQPSQSSVLTLQDCIVAANQADSTGAPGSFGGGIAVSSGDLNLINCQVINNQMLGLDGMGGGIAVGNAGPGNLSITSSLIANNTAAAGGGIALSTTAGNLSVTGSTITSNRATSTSAGGGGVFVASRGAVTLDNDTLTANQSLQGAGGGLDVAVVLGETTAGAASNTVSVQDCTISGNSASSSGAGINDVGTATLTITGSLVTLNQSTGTASNASGGGVYYAGSGVVSITSTLFSGNWAAGAGGGLLVHSAGQALIQDSTFDGNLAGSSGGGVEDTAGTFTVTDTILRNNVAGNGTGGGIDVAAGTNPVVILVSVTLRGNAAVGAADGTGLGGGLSVSSTGATVQLTSALIVNNTASVDGSGVFQSQGTLTIDTSQLVGNQSGDTGALLFSGTTLKVAYSTFNANYTTGSGGAVNFQGTGSGPTGSVLSNDTFTANTADLGGAVQFASVGSLTFDSDTISGNTAAQGGGICVASTGAAILHNTIVALNSASKAGPDVLNGLLFPTAVIDQGGNLIGNLGGSSGFTKGTLTSDPKLGRLENNGGPFAGSFTDRQVVQTEALLPGSLAIGAGVGSRQKADERGFARLGLTVSIGAYEPQYASTASANQAFVEDLYEVLLGRTADAGATSWVGFLDQGALPSAVAQGIENSTEYRALQVQALYQRYLHRSADASGLQAFVDFLGNGGTLEQVAALLVGSQEYFDLHGDSTEGFLDGLYEDALDRGADPLGLASFSQALNGGVSRTQAAALIFGSPEYLGKLVDSEFQSLLGRPADPLGLAGFLSLLQGGASDQVLVSNLLGSGESFGNRT